MGDSSPNIGGNTWPVFIVGSNPTSGTKEY